MYSPKEYVESSLSKLLADYVAEYDGSDFSFGLWQGDLVLRNVTLKPLTINIGDGVVSRLVYGSIDKLHVVIPWSRMSSGHISLAADSINVAVQLSVDQNEDADHKATETLLHKIKMATLDSEERKLLGVSDKSGWKTRMMEGLRSSLLSKLFNGVSAEINDLRVSFVLPLPLEDERAHVQMVTESISISRQEIPSSPDFDQIIGKRIDVRGVTMSIERVRVATEQDPVSLLETRPSGLVLNPMYFTSEMQLGMTTSGAMDVKLQAKLRNTEVTLNLSQLRLIQEILVYSNGESMRWTFRNFRPHVPVMASPKLWWQFAIKAVIRLMRHRDGGDSLGGGAFCSKKESLITLRRRYQELYKRHLENRLLALRYPVEYQRYLDKSSQGMFTIFSTDSSPMAVDAPPIPPVILSSLEEKWIRMKEDEDHMDELHTYFTAKDILLYRATVRQKMRKDRVAFSKALYSEVAGDAKSTSWFGVFGHPMGFPRMSSAGRENDERIEKEILQLCRELDRSTIAGSCGQDSEAERGFNLDVSVTVPRIALCVSSRGVGSEDECEATPRKHNLRSRYAQESSAGASPPWREGRGASPRKRAVSSEVEEIDNTLLTFAIYGLNSTFTKDERQDKTLQLRIGNVSLFGVNGANILTCGTTDTDKWLQHNNGGSADAAYAIESSFQWRQQGSTTSPNSDSMAEMSNNSDSEAEYDLDASELDALTKLIGGSKTHVVVVVTVSSVKVLWDEPTHVLFSNILSDLTSQFLYLDRPKLFVAHKTLCAQLSMNKSCLMDLQARSKFSVEVNVQGIVFECPCVDPMLTNSSHRRSSLSAQSPGARGSNATFRRKKNSIRVLVRSFTVSGGDFLPKVRPYSILEESLRRIPTRSLWKSVELLVEILVGKLSCSVVHPFVYSLNAVELQFVSETRRVAPSHALSSVDWGSSDHGVVEDVVAITGAPLSVACVVSPCDILAHPIFPALRLDVFCSSLELCVSMENMPSIVRTINFLVSYLIPAENARGGPRNVSPQQAPRIRNLAPLCKHRFNFHMDLFDMRINSSSQRSISSTTPGIKRGVSFENDCSTDRACRTKATSRILNDVVETAAMCGVSSVASATRLKLSEERLIYLTRKPKQFVSDALKDLLRNVVRGGDAVAENLNTIAAVMNTLLDDISAGDNGARDAVELFRASFTGIHSNMYSLTYDSKMTLQLEEMTIRDCDGYSVCCVQPVSTGGSDESVPMASQLYQFGDGTMTKTVVSSGYPGKRYTSPYPGEALIDRREYRRPRREGHRSHRHRHRKHPPGPLGPSYRYQRRSRSHDVDSEAAVRQHALQSTTGSFSVFCGLVVTFMEQDKNTGWGVGGEKVGKLYDPSYRTGVLISGHDAHDVLNIPYRMRENKLSVDVKKIESIISPKGLTSFASDVVPIFILSYPLLDHAKWYDVDVGYGSDSFSYDDESDYSGSVSDDSGSLERETGRRNSNLSSRAIPNSWSSYELTVDSAHVVVVLHEKILVVGDIGNTDIEWRQTHCLSRGVPTAYDEGYAGNDSSGVKTSKWLSSSHRLSVGSVDLYDVSDEGRRHVDILWKDLKSTEPVLLLNGISNEWQASIKINITGLRCTFLWRFLFEIIEFSFDHLYAPIALALETCIQTVNERQRANADADADGPLTPSFLIETNKPSFGSPSMTMNETDDLAREDVDRAALLFPDSSDSELGSVSNDDGRGNGPRLSADSDNDWSVQSEVKKESFWARVWKSRWSITLSNTTLILPRNSKSDDLACAVVREATISNSFSQETWGPPPSIPSDANAADASKNGMYFDTHSNSWLWKSTTEEESMAPQLNHLNSSGAGTFVEVCASDGLVVYSDDGESEDVRNRVATHGTVSTEDELQCRVPFADPGSQSDTLPRIDSFLSVGGSGSSCGSRNSSEFESCYGDENDIPQLHPGDDASCSESSSMTQVKRRDSARSSGNFAAMSVNDDSDEFEDAVDHISNTSDEELDLLRAYYSENGPIHRKVPTQPSENATAKSSYFESETGFDSVNDGDDWTIHTVGDPEFQNGPVYRLSLSLQGVELFASIPGPLHHFDDPQPFSGVSGDKKYAEVRHKSHVFHGQSSSKSRSTAADKSKQKQIWKSISSELFNLQIVIDTTDTVQKWLITDTDQSTPLSLKCTMAEFYLLLSVYFDNMSETTVFFEDFFFLQKAAPAPHTYPVHPEYGTKGFWEYVRLRTPSFEFMLTREQVRIECSLEVDNFHMEVPCLSFVNLVTKLGLRTPESVRKNEPLSFSDVAIFKSIVHSKVDNNVTQVVFSAGGVEVIDTRSPIRTIFPTVLSIFPLVDEGSGSKNNSANSSVRNKLGDTADGDLRVVSELSELKWGVADFDFGLKMGPAGVASAAGIPLTVTYFGTGNTWSTTNVGIDSPSIDVKNLDVVYLVEEYFSLYFRYAHFGHPGLAAYSKIPSGLWPYGGVDTRVFVVRPHIQLQENPLASNTQILVVSAESGLYFRYLYDCELSLRMDCTIVGLSAILLKSHRPPSIARSYRGSAGSGKGVRTLIESVLFVWSYHYVKPTNHLDILLSIAPMKMLSRSQASRRWEKIPSQNKRPFTTPKIFSPQGRRQSAAEFFSPGTVREDDAAGGHVAVPFVDFDGDRAAVKLPPLYLPKTVLPLVSSSRSHNINNAYFVSSYEDVLLATALILDFLGLPNMWTECSAAENPESTAETAATDPPLPSMFAIVRVADTKIILVDDVLGLHLPIFQCNISEVAGCFHRSPIIKTTLLKDIILDEMMSSAEAAARETMSRRNSVPVRSLRTTAGDSTRGLHRSNSDPSQTNVSNSVGRDSGKSNAAIGNARTDMMHLRCYGHSSFGGDYFNNIKKCWEPLVAPFSAVCLYEKSANRGLGITLRFTSTLRVNVSVALVRTLHDALRAVQVANETARDEYYANKGDDLTSEKQRKRGTHPQKFDQDGHTVLSGNTSGPVSRGETAIHDGASVVSDFERIAPTRTTVATAARRLSASIDDTRGVLLHRRPSRYNHVATQSLNYDARVGFSILNLTGQPLRYVQYFSSSRATMVHYLEHDQRGLLNFVPSKTSIRNNQVVEEQFGHFKQEILQSLGQKALQSSARRSKEVGHHIAVQICGYKWLSSLQADALGIHFKDLHSIIGCLNATTIANDCFKKRQAALGNDDNGNISDMIDWRTKNALKLVAEVRPHNGGRMLLLRSAFAVKNSTTHDINLITNFNSVLPDPPENGKPDHFHLKSGETFFIPLSLINESVLRSFARKSVSDDKGAVQFGCLWLRPSSMQPVRSELGPSSQYVKSMTYSGDPIILKDVATTSEINHHEQADASSTGTNLRAESYSFLADGKFKQLSCTLSTRVTDGRGGIFDDEGASGPADDDRYTDERDGAGDFGDTYGLTSAPVVNSDKLPPFCYNIEVQKSGADSDNAYTVNSDRPGSGFMSMFSSNKNSTDGISRSPLQYTIVIHPPIVLENLLPMKGIFELIHATHKTVLWSSVIAPGKAVPVHTVTLDVPIMLNIILDFCRSTQGLVVHKPVEISRDDLKFTDKLQQKIEGFLEEGEDGGVSSIMLSDSVGQPLRLLVENNVGGGGQRNIVIFCPYWLLNTSQYTIRLREDGGQVFPAGTVTAQRDGTRPIVSGSHLQGSLQGDVSGYVDELGHAGPVFPGRPGPLHSTRVKEVPNDSSRRKYLHDVRFEDICELATLFNFMEDAHILGSRKVVAQLDESNWSRSFTLDSAGVAQTLSVEQPDKGMLELAFKVMNGPGRLANYTKIIRFSPRFVVVNKLPKRVTLMQTNGFTYDDIKIVDVSSDHLTTFHLPSVYGERQLCIQMEGPWSRSVLFDVDHIGTHTFNITPEINFDKLHVNTRGAPIYDVILDPGEVGLYFETDWGGQDIIVKRVRPGSFAARKTDIQPGDVLIAIDAEEIDGRDFEGTMATLKAKQAVDGCVLKFQTIEAKLQNIRGSAMSRITQSNLRHESIANLSDNNTNNNDLSEMSVRLEMRPMDATVFMILSEYDKTSRPEYRIENQSACHVIEYKQKGAALGRWESLDPGCSASYIWENPFKPHKLLVRVVNNMLCPTDYMNSGANQPKKQSGQAQQNEQYQSVHQNGNRKTRTEDLTLSVHLDDIKWHGVLHVPRYSGDGKLVAKIQSEGMTKILKVTMDHDLKDTEYKYAHDFTASQVDALDILKLSVDGLRPHQLQKSLTINHLGGEKTHTPIAGLTSFQDILELRMKQSLDEIRNLQSRLLEAQRCLLDTDTNALASVTNFDSVLGTTITKQDQILVQVLEAKKLKAVSYGASLESYCEVYLKGSLLKRGWYTKKYVTTTCEGTTDPNWSDQTFVFDVPVLSSDSVRGNSVRINVKTKNLLGDNWVGQADIQLASLVHENTLTGWFPIRPRKATIAGAAHDELQHNGSIKLRVEWIHSNEALKKHLKAAIKKRRDELTMLLSNLERSLEVILQSRANIPRRNKQGGSQVLMRQNSDQMNVVLKQLKDINENASRDDSDVKPEVNMARQRALTSSTKLLAMVSESSRSLRAAKRPLSKRSLMHGISNVSFREEPLEDKRSVEFRDDMAALDELRGPSVQSRQGSTLESPLPRNALRQATGTESEPKATSSAKTATNHYFVRPDELHPLCASSAKKYLAKYHAMTIKTEGEPEYSTSAVREACVAMLRRDDVTVQESNYTNFFDEESNRNYMNILSMAGTVEITAIQALHLPVSNRPVFVKISYGGVTARTTRTPPTAHPAWVNEEDIAPMRPGVHTGGPLSSGSEGGEHIGSADHTAASGRRQNHAKAFDIDTFNSRGVFHIAVMIDDFPHNKEIAKLDISVFNLLDCIATLDTDEVYDMWFPLSLTHESVRTDGDIGGSFTSMYSEKKASHQFGYHSCIRLQFKWKPSRITAMSLAGNHSTDFYARIQLPYLSVALIDSIRVREVFQIIISDVEARHTSNSAISESSLTVQWLQIDNQLPNPIALVILSPTPTKHPQPVLRFYIKQNHMLSHKNLQCFDVIDLIIQALDLRLEQQTVMAVWDVVKSSRQEQRATTSEYEDEDGTGNDVPIDKLGFSSCVNLKSQDFLSAFAKAGDKEKAMYEDDTDKIYIDRFQIGPMKINVSFIMTPTAVRSSNRVVGDSHAAMSQLDDSGVYTFFWQVGEVVLDLTSTITDAPIKLGVIQADNVFKTWSEFTSTLQGHYLSSALGQMYKIVGSLDLVGNPVGLLSSLGTGVKDFFYEPGHALITSPTEISKIGRGVVKGTVSLLVNTSDGFIGTATTMTRSFGKGIAALSMDNAFLRNREALQRRPNGILATALRPVKDISNGIFCGVVGIVRVPYHSIKRQGLAGLVPGVAKGLAGVPAKPVVGVLDALTHSGDALRDLVKELAREPGEPAFRRSLSNLFGPDGRLMPYSLEASYGAYVLRVIDEYFKEKLKTKPSKRQNFISKHQRDSMDALPDHHNERTYSINTIDDDPITDHPQASCFPFLKGCTRPPVVIEEYDAYMRNYGHSEVFDEETPPAGRVYPMRKQKSFGIRDRAGTNYVGGSQLLSRHRASTYDATSSGSDRRGTGSHLSYVHESVVYTAVVSRGPAKDSLVIVTNCRVVIAICRWDAHGIFIDCKWDCELGMLKKPMLKNSGGGSVILQLKSDKRGHESDDDAIESISGDNNVILHLFNCINTVLLHFDSMNTVLLPSLEGDRWREDIYGVIHIGPWEYSRTLMDDVTAVAVEKSKLDTHVVKDLELVEWVVAPDAARFPVESNIPDWLTDYCQASCAAHSRVNQYSYLSAIGREDSETVSLLKHKLLTGKIDGSEYTELMKFDAAARGNEDVAGHGGNRGRYAKFRQASVMQGVGNSFNSEDEDSKKSNIAKFASKWMKKNKKTKSERNLNPVGTHHQDYDRTHDRNVHTIHLGHGNVGFGADSVSTISKNSPNDNVSPQSLFGKVFSSNFSKKSNPDSGGAHSSLTSHTPTTPKHQSPLVDRESLSPAHRLDHEDFSEDYSMPSMPEIDTTLSRSVSEGAANGARLDIAAFPPTLSLKSRAQSSFSLGRGTNNDNVSDSGSGGQATPTKDS